MTPLFFQDEVFLDCRNSEKIAGSEFTFKGKTIYVMHHLDRGFKKFIHRITCEVDGQKYSFGFYRYHPGQGHFGTWPEIIIEGKPYCFQIEWTHGEGPRGIRIQHCSK